MESRFFSFRCNCQPKSNDSVINALLNARTPTMLPFRYGKKIVLLQTIAITISRIPAVAAMVVVDRIAASMPRNEDEKPQKIAIKKINFAPGIV